MRVALVNMPFCYLESPSLALAQLRSVIRSTPSLAGCVEVSTAYVQHDFASWFGMEAYHLMADSGDALLGEWLFSPIAFPGPRDNSADEAYLERYLPPAARGREVELLALRAQLGAFLTAIIEEYHLDQADVVGLTTLYQQTVPSLALLRALRDLPGERTLVLGGGNCEGRMGRALIEAFEPLDFVFSGSGLVSFPAFLERRLAGDLEACDRLDGVFSRRNHSAGTWDARATSSRPPPAAVVVNAGGRALPVLNAGKVVDLRSPPGDPVGLHGPERDINDVVAIEYHCFLDSLDAKVRPLASSIQPRLVLETSRGCWWGEKAHCTFCGSCGWDISYKSMRSEIAIDYMNAVLDAHQPRCRFFECCDQLIPKPFPQEVIPHLRLRDKSGLFYEVRVTLPEDDLRAMSAAGVRAIQPGVESLSTTLLKRMAKGVTAAQNLLHLKRCLRHGISPMWILLVGLPGEEEGYYHHYREILVHLVHLPPPMGLTPVGFHRNSPYTWYPDKYGLNLAPDPAYEYIYPYAPEVLRELAYFFKDITLNPPYRRHIAQHVPDLEARVGVWQAAWFQRTGPQPQLCFQSREADGAQVYDTRMGTPQILTLDKLEVEILERLAEPAATSRLAEALDASPADVAHRVTGLERRGLLFVDGAQAISLVLETPFPVPPVVKWLRQGEVTLH